MLGRMKKLFRKTSVIIVCGAFTVVALFALAVWLAQEEKYRAISGAIIPATITFVSVLVGALILRLQYQNQSSPLKVEAYKRQWDVLSEVMKLTGTFCISLLRYAHSTKEEIQNIHLKNLHESSEALCAIRIVSMLSCSEALSDASNRISLTAFDTVVDCYRNKWTNERTEKIIQLYNDFGKQMFLFVAIARNELKISEHIGGAKALAGLPDEGKIVADFLKMMNTANEMNATQAS